MLNKREYFSPRPFACHQPGEIVTARVLNPLENSATKGKARPAILIRREGARWLLMGLTTRSHFANGKPRQSVPNPMACGLDKPAFLWGSTTWVCALDVGDHIGHVDDDLLALIALH